jgi:hypothetical protein
MGFLKTLFIGGRDGLSLGRFAFWLFVIPALYRVWLGADIQTNHLALLGFFLTYLLGGKVSGRIGGIGIKVPPKGKDGTEPGKGET